MTSFCVSEQAELRRDFGHGWQVVTRCVVERDRGSVSDMRSITLGWPTAVGSAGRVDCNAVCAQDGHRLGGLADRSLRLLVQDVPSTNFRVIEHRSVAANPGGVPDQATWCRPTRLVTGAGRFEFSEGPAGRRKCGPNPTDRGRSGSKHCLLTDASGIPLVVQLLAANQHDVNTCLPLVIDMPAVAGKPGRPKQKPKALVADKGFDCKSLRQLLRWLGIEPLIPRRGESERGLGKRRWFIESHFELAPPVQPSPHALGPQPIRSPSLPQSGGGIICYRTWINEA